MSDWGRALEKNDSPGRGICGPGFVAEMLSDLDVDSTAWHGDNLWSMLVMEMWMEKHRRGADRQTLPSEDRFAAPVNR